MESSMSRIFLALLLPLLLMAGGAAAELTATEQRIRELAQKQPTSSVVFLEVKLLEGGKDYFCPLISVTVVSDQGASSSFTVQDAHAVPFTGRAGYGAEYGGIALLPAGTYTIASIQCRSLLRLNGKFARFSVGPNEITNSGCLVLDFKRGPLTLFDRPTFSGRTGAEALGAMAARSLAERAPTIFPKATKRYLTPNPATSGKRAS